MIEIGKDIISLRSRYGPPWSRFAFLFRYGNTCRLLHRLTSALIECNDATTARISTNRLTKRDRTILRVSKLFASDSEDDTLFKEVRFKVNVQLARVRVETLFIIATDRCNLRCVYCYENLPKFSVGRTMSFDQMKHLIDLFLSDGTAEKKIFFYGGEPMLAWRTVKRCIEYVRDRYGSAVNLQITTNGTVNTDELFEVCRTHQIGVAVSLDGPEAVTNRTRPAKSLHLNVFQSAFALLQRAKEVGLDYAALCTIAQENASQLEEMTNFFITHNIRNLIFNLRLRRSGEVIKEDLQFWDDLGRRMAIIYRNLQTHGILEGRSLRYLGGLVESTFTISECDAGYGSQIVANPEGLIGPCQGFLHQDGFWIKPADEDNIKFHPLWQQFQKNTTLDMSLCQVCPLTGTCGGGCHYNRPTFSQPNPNFCQYLRSFIFYVLCPLSLKERR